MRVTAAATSRRPLWESHKAADDLQMACRVVAIDYEFPVPGKDPFLPYNDLGCYMSIKLECIDDVELGRQDGGGGGGGGGGGNGGGGTQPLRFTVLYRPSDLPDFLVLKQRYLEGASMEWTTHDSCRVLFGDTYYDGTILSSALDQRTQLPVWEGVSVMWSGGGGMGASTSRLSAWEIEATEGDDRKGRGSLGKAAVSDESFSARPERAAEVKAVVNAAMRHELAVFLISAVTPDVAPGYDESIPVPMYFELIKARLNRSYYRQAQAVADDARIIYRNCVEYNGADSPISQNCKAVTDAVRTAILKRTSFQVK